MEEIKIEYAYPKLGRRIWARIVDFLIMILLFLISFISVRSIYTSTSTYKNNIKKYEEIRLDSGLYIQDDTKIISVVTSTYNDSKTSYAKKNVYLEKAINNFLFYMSSLNIESYNKVKTDYDEARLSSSLTYNNLPLFIKNSEGEIVRNSNLVNVDTESKTVEETYYSAFYTVYIENNCIGYLTTENKEYYEINKYIANMMILVDFPISLILSSLLVYFLPPLILKRGRQTLGMWIYHISFASKSLYSLTFKEWIIKFLIFYFFEFILSLFTFAIPLFISATMMLFTKSKQNFNEYMCRIYEIDTEKDKLFKNKSEIMLENISHSEGIDFKMR